MGSLEGHAQELDLDYKAITPSETLQISWSLQGWAQELVQKEVECGHAPDGPAVTTLGQLDGKRLWNQETGSEVGAPGGDGIRCHLRCTGIWLLPSGS